MAQNESKNTLCEYLEAIGGESVLPLPVPSHRHRCTAFGERRHISSRTQATFCLSEQHTKCPYFHTDSWTSPVPETTPEQQIPPDLSGLDFSGS
jgi:hypothetical protein